MAYWMNGKFWSAPRGTECVEKLDWLDPPLPYTGENTEEITLVWYRKRIGSQDLPFGELMMGTGPYHKVKAQRNAVRGQLVLHGTNTMPRPQRTQAAPLGLSFASDASWPQRLSQCSRKCRRAPGGVTEPWRTTDI